MLDGELMRYAATVTADRRIGNKWNLGFAGGSTIEGTLAVQGVTHVLQPGVIAAVTASYRQLDEGLKKPFVLITLSLAASFGATTGPEGSPSRAFTGVDFRGGVVTGKTFADVITLYAVGRVFGGPVVWSIGGSTVVGTDAWHIQLGGGLVVRWKRFDLVIEGVPLGEQSVIVGMGFAI